MICVRDTLQAALEPLEALAKTNFSGEVVAVLAPSHGQIPLYRAQLPGQLVRGSRTELPNLPRPERSFWPHCEDVIRMTEVPLHVPGTQRGREERPRSTSRSPPRVHMLIQEEDEFEMPYFDAEAALAAARRERTQRAESTERGRPLGQGGQGGQGASGRDDPESKESKRISSHEVVLEVPEAGSREAGQTGQTGQTGQAGEMGEMPRGQDPNGAEVRTLSIPSREPSLERDKAAQAACSRSLAKAEAMMMASIRPRPKISPKLQLVGRPPVVEVEAPQAAQRRVPERGSGSADAERAERGRSPERNNARMSLMAPRPKKSPRDHRAREKIGKLLVAHYEVRTRNEAKKWSRMLMRVILAGEEKNPDALVEGITLLQNAQNLIGSESDAASAKSRVVLQALCLVDRKVKVRSALADSVRTLEELTKRKEKLLVDMMPLGAEEAAVDIHLDDTEPTLAENLKRAWQEVHREATVWPPMEKSKESATAKNESRLKKKTEAEKEAALEQMKKSLGTAVWRFAQAEAKKMEADAEAMDGDGGTDADAADADTDALGEEALQRAARIEYAIKAAVAQAVDSKHPHLLKALQITYDLRAFRAMRYCQHLMSTIEQGVVGSAGKIANMIDKVIQDASELYNVPKDHRYMEEARRLVLKARAEEAQAKRRDKR